MFWWQSPWSIPNQPQHQHVKNPCFEPSFHCSYFTSWRLNNQPTNQPTSQPASQPASQPTNPPTSAGDGHPFQCLRYPWQSPWQRGRLDYPLPRCLPWARRIVIQNPIPKCVVGCKNLCFSLLGEKLCPKPKLQLSNIRKRPPEDFFFRYICLVWSSCDPLLLPDDLRSPQKAGLIRHPKKGHNLLWDGWRGLLRLLPKILFGLIVSFSKTKKNPPSTPPTPPTKRRYQWDIPKTTVRSIPIWHLHRKSLLHSFRWSTSWDEASHRSVVYQQLQQLAKAGFAHGWWCSPKKGDHFKRIILKAIHFQVQTRW